MVNGVGLYRNNSIPVYTGDNDDNRPGGSYYSPDYLIEVEENGTKRYLILDAKFSDLTSVKRHHVKDLAFKYLFSISPIHPDDSVVGMCIIYGKCEDNEVFLSAYDNELSGKTIAPTADLLPLIEGVATEGHYSKLDQLLKRIIR